MDAQFEKALQIVLKHEGGYGNDPADSGGPTNFGITQHDLSVHRGHSVSANDVKNMTEAEAAVIYYDRYWMPYHLNQLTSYKVSCVIFDQGVLSGPPTIIKLCQHCVGVPADGVMGPMTIGMINQSNPQSLGARLLDACEEHYKNIVLRIPRDQKFLRGWTNRVNDLRAFIRN